jgi:hypothetical protein
MMAVMMMVGIEFALLVTPTPDPSPQGGGEQQRRAWTRRARTAHGALPPPLRGRVGEGGNSKAVCLRLPLRSSETTPWT